MKTKLVYLLSQTCRCKHIAYACLFLSFFVSLLAVPAAATAQSSTQVRGTISDSKSGETIIGASILEVGTSNGTTTDVDGNFSLSVSPNATLRISYVGYVTQDVKVVAGRAMDIKLVEESRSLDEVVVVGFGTQKKVNLTGAVSVATAKELDSRPVSSAPQALQGLASGLFITTNTGELNAEMKIQIRGIGTIGEGSSGSPLILIDGMEGDINTINPQDIETVSVLKDAAASSIYGSRAPYGVVLITTKQGTPGKMSINYNNNFRLSSPINMPEQMNSYDFAVYYNQASHNAGKGDVFTRETMQQMLDFQKRGGTNGRMDTGGLLTDGKVWGKPAGDPFTTAYANVDWYKEIYKSNVFSQEHNVSATGGNERVTFYASLGLLDQNGQLNFGSDGNKRVNTTARINATLTKWLKLSYNMRYSRLDNWRPRNFGNGLYDRIGRQTWPNLPVYDENGYFTNDNADPPSVMLALGGQRTQQTDRLSQQGALILEPVKGWMTHFEYNYSTNDYHFRSIQTPYYNHDVEGNVIDTQGDSSVQIGNGRTNFVNINVYSEYAKTFAKMHNAKVMVGYQSEENQQEVSDLLRYGLLSLDQPEINLATDLNGKGAYKAPIYNGYRNEWASAGFFGRVNYDYNGKYLLELNYRYDGSSRFRRGNRWQGSPSASAGWNIAHEEFWKPFSHIVNTLKLSGSYGQLGNQNTSGWYPTYRSMTLGNADGSWLQNGARPSTARVGDLISTSLTWETVRTWNVGLDFGMLNNRLAGRFEVFTRYTDNMVGAAPDLPNTLGIGAPRTNDSSLKTKGWELEIAWRDRLSNGLRYGIKGLLWDARNYVVSYPGNITNNISTYISGREIGEIWGYETIGIAQTNEEMQAHLDKVGGQSALGSQWAAGDIMYADLDGKPGITGGSGIIGDTGDRKVIGNNTPRLSFSLDLTAEWKGFDFRAFFQGVGKRDYWSGSPIFWGATSNMWWSAGFKAHADYWHSEPLGLNGEIAPNTNAYYPRPVFDTSKNQQAQSKYLQDASYVRLKNLQLGYSLPRSVIGKLGLSRIRLYVSGENLLTFTKLSKVFDPETISGGYGTTSTPNYGNAYPLSSVLSFGLSVTL